MSEANKAVFLSYASQDAPAVERIAEALRAAGVEVWFDKNELVGGDAWDQKIRRQIKDCALFVPVISANTNARAEGYFRLEWKLAVDRSHLMADDAPFLFPVVIDDTSDAAARVPDRFRDVQWTRLNVKDTPESLAKRVSRLLGGEEVARAFQPVGSKDTGWRARATSKQWNWVGFVATIGGITIGMVYAFRPMWESPRRREPKPAAVATVPAPAPPALSPPNPSNGLTEGGQLAARALALITKVGFTRDDLGAAEDFARRATEKEPDNAAAWGVRAGVQAAWLFRNWDLSEKRLQDTQTFANRALALDPNEPEAQLALGHLLTRQRAFEQAEAQLGRASAAHPDHVRLARARAYALNLAGREAEARAALLATAQRVPRDPLLRYELAMTYGDYGHISTAPGSASAAIEQLDAALAIQPFSSALLLKAVLLAGWRGDLAGMRTVLDQHGRLAMTDRSEDRAVAIAMWAGLLEGRPDRVEAAAVLTARNYFDDAAIPLRPKAWSLALAHQAAGKAASARNDWQAAEEVLRQRLKDDPVNARYQVELATTLAWLGQREEAIRLVGLVEPLWKENRTVRQDRELARFYGALGDAKLAALYLPSTIDLTPFTSRKVIPLDPWWDKLRGSPEFDALVREPEAKK